MARIDAPFPWRVIDRKSYGGLRYWIFGTAILCVFSFAFVTGVWACVHDRSYELAWMTYYYQSQLRGSHFRRVAPVAAIL